MRKELFMECLNNLERYDKWEHQLYDLGVNFWEREEVSELISSYVKLLAYICKDECNNVYDNGNIDYYIYELDYGKKADDYYITEEDGTKIRFRGPEDVWDYLVKCHPEIDDTNIEEAKAKKAEQAKIFEELKTMFDNIQIKL